MINKYNKITKNILLIVPFHREFNHDNIIISNSRKGSVKIDVFFITPGIYDDRVLEAEFSDCKELVKIHGDVLMQVCQLDKIQININNHDENNNESMKINLVKINFNLKDLNYNDENFIFSNSPKEVCSNCRMWYC